MQLNVISPPCLTPPHTNHAYRSLQKHQKHKPHFTAGGPTIFFAN